ncbi:MAG: DNA polymerase III subunit alpha, partial [Clostridia bacterium]|nr:DNA polymerase III subunit alpha [Clostridia bacterium]
LVRRAMAKKKHDVMAKERQYFVYGSEEEGVRGAVASGVPAEVAEKIFDEMTAFASYAFNKSHAAAYGVVAVRTAWLKKHWPAEFMAAMMNSFVGNAPKIAAYIHYCRSRGIPVLPPDINRSGRRFTVELMADGKPAVRFGLGGVKNVGLGAVDHMIAERRQNGPYRDVFDFCRRVGGQELSKRAVECLIMAGSFDRCGATRSQTMAVYDSAMASEAQNRRNNVAGQLSLFDLGMPAEYIAPTERYPQMPEYSRQELLRQEKEVTGVYLSGHPLDEYESALEGLPFHTDDLLELLEREDKGISEDGKPVRMGGLIVKARSKATKKGALMGFLTLEDLTGQIECLLFPKVYELYAAQAQEDAPVIVSGRLSIREDEDPKLLVDAVEPLIRPLQGETAKHPPEAPPEPQPPKAKLYLRLNRAQQKRAEDILRRFPGGTPVYLNFPREQITLLAPQTLWVAAESDVLPALDSLLGTENVRLVQK